MFQFKQFAVDQSGCAMKINTDGVLLGALANTHAPKQILDIGTGTGVIALMLAQRFENAFIDALEIDKSAASTASQNLENSKFHNRLSSYTVAFQDFFLKYTYKKYDLIVSNPPFYINSLRSPEDRLNTAKHANESFFEDLLSCVKNHLCPQGIFWIIVPLDTSALIKKLASTNGLKLNQIIEVRSYPDSEPHRQIIAFSLEEYYITPTNFVIYESPKIYTEQYKTTLKNFFTIF